MGSGKGPPENLVFGAKLKCNYSYSPSFLFVDEDRETFNNLQVACVTDRIPGVNIMPFGACRLCQSGAEPCTIQTPDRWENPSPQHEYINGEEVITTDSYIICTTKGIGTITPVNSGQDGEIAAQLRFLQNMAKIYPDLFEILGNRYGSLYLDDGMWEKALSFLGDVAEFKGGQIELHTLGENDLLNPLILASINHLTGADVTKGLFDNSMKGLAHLSVLFPDAKHLDSASLESFKEYGVVLKREVEAGGYWAWREENKETYETIVNIVNMVLGMATTYAYMSAMRPPATNRSNSQRTVEFNGKTITQNDDLFDPYFVDDKGRTNLQRMENGLAPIGADGKSVNIHHVDQTNTGPLIEMGASYHQSNYRDLHTNTGQSPSQIDRPAFNNWRGDYWRWRSTGFD